MTYIFICIYTHSFIFTLFEVGVLVKDVVCPKFGMAVLVLSSEPVSKQHNYVMLCDPASLAKCTVSKKNVVMFCHC